MRAARDILPLLPVGPLGDAKAEPSSAVVGQGATIASSAIDKDTEAFIDAFRGLAAFGVLVTHAVDLGIRGAYGQDLTAAPVVWQWAAATVGHGSFLVWGFFVVSGLCIHLSVGRSIGHGGFSWTGYSAARVTRIYPLFLLGLLLAVAVWWLTDHLSGEHPTRPWPQFAASLVSLQILTNTFPAFDPSWSLSNEMIYYFVWPLMLLGFRWRFGAAFRFSIAASLSLAAAIFLLWRVLHRFESSTAVNGLWTVSILFPLWLAGAWLAQNWSALAHRVSRNAWLGAILLCLASELVLAVVKHHEPAQSVIDFTGLSSIPGLVLLFAGARHLRLASFVKAQPLIRWLARFSYPCYVLHMPLLFAANRLLNPRSGVSPAAEPMLRSLLLLMPVLFVLALIGPWLESRAMTWRTAFLAKMRA